MSARTPRAETEDLNAWRGENDAKQYRLVRLENGLECVLVSAENEAPVHAARALQQQQDQQRLDEVGPGVQEPARDAGGHSPAIAPGSRKSARLSRRTSVCSHYSRASSVASGRNSQRRASATTRLPKVPENNSSHADDARPDARPVTVHGKPDANLKSNRIASVSMAVGVGSFSDPDGCAGLAHFVEHMLFMGSTKYPQENEFDSFLYRNGGTNNAYTDTERTVYYFSCFQKDLSKALDIFAQFFIEPLMLEEAASRELEAIESEFANRCNHDECRHMEIWRASSRPSTPFAKFTCGNEETLRVIPERRGVDIHSELRKFHDRFYVAPNMRLVIVGHAGLDELQESVCELFAGVREGTNDPGVTLAPTILGAGAPWRMGSHRRRAAERLLAEGISEDILGPDLDKVGGWKPPRPGYDGLSLGCVFGFAPVSDSHCMTITWQIPPQYHHYQSSACKYIDLLLGHASNGSIIADLKARGWATGLETSCSSDLGGFEDSTSCSIVLVKAHLTLDGLVNWIFVAGVVFEYIGMLVREGPQRRIYEETLALDAMAFRFKEDENYADLAETISVRMLPQAAVDKDWLLGASTRVVWDPDQIEDILNHCRPELARVDLQSNLWGLEAKRLSPEVERRVAPLRLINQPECALRREQYTEARYWARFVPEEVLDIWRGLLDGSKAVILDPDAERLSGLPAIETAIVLDDEDAAWSVPTPKNTFQDQLERGIVEERDTSTGSSLHLPPRNPYIPGNFDLVGPNEVLNVCTEGPLVRAQVASTEVHYVRRFVRSSLRDDLAWSNELVQGVSTSEGSLTDEVLLRGPVDAKRETRHGVVILHDEPSARILVDYGHGLYAWHRILDEDLNSKRIAVDAPGLKLRVLWSPARRSRAGTLSAKLLPPMPTSPAAAVAAVGSKALLRRKTLQMLASASPGLLTPSAAALDDISDSALRKIWSAFPTIKPEHVASSVPALVRVGLVAAGRDAVAAESGSESDDDDGVGKTVVVPGLRLWYVADRFTRIPRTEINVRLVSPLPSVSPVFRVLAGLLVRLWIETVKNESHLASLAELKVEITSDEEGLNLNLSGMSNRIITLLDTTFAMLSGIGATSRKYGAGKAHASEAAANEPLFMLIPEAVYVAQLHALRQSYDNESSHFTSEGPLSAALYKILVHGSWQPELLALAAHTVRPGDVADFAALLLRRSNVDACISGNVDASMAESAHRVLSRHLHPFGHQGLPLTSLPQVNVLEVPVSRPNPNKSDPWHALSGLVHPLEALEFEGHSVDLYFQLGQDVLEVRLLAEMIEFLIKEPIFAELRTRLQLGYVVQAKVVTVLGVVGMLIEVTSNKFTPPEIAMYVDTFLQNFYDGLVKMDIEEFHLNVCALARTKLEEERGVQQQGKRLWETIKLQPFRSPPSFEWKSNVQEIECLRSRMSHKSVLAAYARWLLPSSTQRRRVSVLVFGADYENRCVDEILERRKYISMVDSDFIYRSSAMCMPRLCVPPLEAQDKPYRGLAEEAVPEAAVVDKRCVVM